MKEKNAISISFYQRLDKVDNENTAPIYMRITVNGARTEIATNKRLDIGRWKSGHPLGTKSDVKELQKDFDSMKARVNKICRDMNDRHEAITGAIIKERFKGHDKNSKTLVEAFTFHNTQISELVNIEYSPVTVQRYETCKAHVLEYMKLQYHRDDMYLAELKYDFISGFEHFLKTDHHCSHNTTMKYIKNFRKVINLALKYEWLDKDPFRKFKITIRPVERDFLTIEELFIIENKQSLVPRIEQIRDMFVFCCYTGLAYVDVAKLNADHIVNGIDGTKWINLNRTKTNTKSQIPLLPKALEILEKYSDVPKHIPGSLLPVISNQKMNAFLKELGGICGITKTLTFHLARHTFATSVTLTNGVPIESVSAMLGHKSISTTQIYSKVVERKVSNDMAALREKLESKVNSSKAS